MAEPSFPWEREAMEGRSVPQGLSLTDQKAYHAFVLLYGRYRLGLIDRAAGSVEKKKILWAWSKEKTQEEIDRGLAHWHIRLQDEIGSAHTRYLKERTPENAERLSNALMGILEGLK